MLFRKTEPETPKTTPELAELGAALEKAQLPEVAAQVARKELERLEKMDPRLPEYAIGLNYLDLLASLPWTKFTEDNLDLQHAEHVLERLHYGLDTVKGTYSGISGRPDPLQPADLPGPGGGRRGDCPELTWNTFSARTAIRLPLPPAAWKPWTGSRPRTSIWCSPISRWKKWTACSSCKPSSRCLPATELVMITGYATVSTAVDALRKGAAHYLSKPINLDDLRLTVKELVGKKKHFQMSRGPVLCFAGPPGTGKTSIGQAIAEALGRKFVRLSLAGLRDEAELRGHRRTYVGALPGRIINEIRRLGVNNPVFMLDEIDKLGQDFRGDPASVLLEVLDPEQNRYFVDHYLDVPFDLSRVMFVATANVVEACRRRYWTALRSSPFRAIPNGKNAKSPCVIFSPGSFRTMAWPPSPLSFPRQAITRVIQAYTREAGLRQLDRVLATISRKLARLCLRDLQECKAMHVDADLVEKLLGPRKFTHEILAARDRLGVATGLVWTEFGGEIIFVEATRMKGHKQLILTGSMGEVLRESAQTALSYVRSHAEDLRIDPDFFSSSDIHIHIPSGAVPKEGPSAGDHPGRGPYFAAHRPSRPSGGGPDRRNYPERRPPARQRHPGKTLGCPTGRRSRW